VYVQAIRPSQLILRVLTKSLFNRGQAGMCRNVYYTGTALNNQPEGFGGEGAERAKIILLSVLSRRVLTNSSSLTRYQAVTPVSLPLSVRYNYAVCITLLAYSKAAL